MHRPVLVTGASGYVGRFVCRELLAQGRPVVGTFLTREAAIPGADLVPVDLRDAGACRRLLRDLKPGAVVHCAATTEVAFCEREPESADAANRVATENICAAVREFAPATRLVALSTDMVFSGDKAPYDERAEPAPINAYGRSKAAAEPPVLALDNAAVLRSALVYGPPAGAASSFLTWIVSTLARGEELTLFSDEFRTAVFVDDLARAILLLLGNSETGIFHAAGAERLSRLDFGLAVAEAFGLPTTNFRPAKRRDAPGGQFRPGDLSLETGHLGGLGWHAMNLHDALRACRERWIVPATG
jgi:dTDP-4-dehydrorhamnose reductase